MQVESLHWHSWTPGEEDAYSNQSIVPHEVLEALQAVPLFNRSHDPLFLEKIACCITLQVYSPRDVIITEGEPAKAMFFVLRGTVDVCSVDFERVYASLSRGAYFGEIGILYSIPRTATVVAQTRCTVGLLKAKDVATILPSYPDIERDLRFEAQERLLRLNQCKQQENAPSVEFSNQSFSSSSARDLLQRVSFFNGCPDNFLHAISLRVQPTVFSPNAMIVRKGDVGTGLYFIVNGTVEVVASDDPEAPVLKRLGPGDFFGEIAVLLKMPRTAFVRSITSVELLLLSCQHFEDVCSQFPEMESHFQNFADDAKRRLREDQNTQEKDEQESGNTVISASSVCSTTSDQDPTLPLPSMNTLIANEPRKRRPSVAVWSDPHLLALANQKQHQASLQHESPPKRPMVSLSKDAAMGTKDMLARLSPNIIEHMLGHLDFADQCRFATVSRRYNCLVRELSNLFHTVDLHPYHRSMSDAAMGGLGALLGERVRVLSLSHCFHLTDEGIIALVSQTPNLESLNLNSCWLITDETLSALGIYCPRITQLDLSNCRKVTDAGLRMITSLHPVLTHLTLSYCKNITNATLQALQSCSNTLEHLNIQRCTKISDGGFLAWAAHPFPAMRSIDLSDCSFLTDQGIAALVAGAPNLEQVVASFCCALSDSSIAHFAQLRHLTYLDVSFCGAAVSDGSIHALAEKRSQTLRKLNLRGCVRLTGIGIMTAVEASGLDYLNISQCSSISPQIKCCLERSDCVSALVT